MITRHGLDGRSLVQGEEGAIFGDDLLPLPPLLFLPFLPPSVQEEVATTLWPSVPSWNSNESSLLSIWWDYIWNNYHSAVYLK